jgi:epoxyqueuosine reductase QueG
VTTDLELEPDAPVSLGVGPFCEICKKCADNCPSRSLSREGKVDVNGVPRWPTDVESCHAYWRRAGSDCGICMAVCPFSHRDTTFHRVVRAGLRRFPGLAPMALWGDDLLYGRDWRRRRFR